MQLWLKSVPDEAVRFCQIMLIMQFFGLLNSILIIGVHATGQIKTLSYVGGTAFLLMIPVIWICFKLGLPVYVAYLVSIPQIILTYVFDMWLLKRHIKEVDLYKITFNVSLSIVICLTAFGMTLYLTQFITNHLLQFIFSFFFNAISIATLSCLFIKDFNILKIKSLLNR